MSYENPDQPEGINVSDEHPVRELFVLLTAVITGVVLLVIVLSSIASWLAQYVPFSTEQQLADMVGIEQMFKVEGENLLSSEEHSTSRETFVKKLSEALITHADLREDIQITVHYKPDDTVNAFATLGGHIVLYDGLLSRLPNENSLAMVLAHEIGHIKLRHPIVAMSRGLTVSLALGSFFGLTDNAFVGRVVEWIGYSSTLSFSREQEREADAFAADLLINYYGHLNGAESLFDAFSTALTDTDSRNLLPTADFLSTHPGLAERIDDLRQRADQLGATGEPNALPW